MTEQKSISLGALAPALGDCVQFVKGHTGADAGTIIAYSHKDCVYPYMVGWKNMQIAPFAVENILGSIGDPRTIPDTTYLHNIEDYPKSIWLSGNVLVLVNSTAAINVVIGGMNCSGKYCHEFNLYAQPNQPDGNTFLCYSCRGIPACLR